MADDHVNYDGLIGSRDALMQMCTFNSYKNQRPLTADTHSCRKGAFYGALHEKNLNKNRSIYTIIGKNVN